MDALIKLNSQTAGRDKIARLLQYLSRVLWNKLNNKDGLKNLEFQLSSFRKLLRFGRCIDTLYSTLPLFQHGNTTVQFTVILSKICNALFLLADHILWMGRADLCKVDTDKWGRISNKYWLYSITMNLIRDFYEISIILKTNQDRILPVGSIKTTSDVIYAVTVGIDCIRQNKAVFMDTIKNSCDFFIPLTTLGHINLSSGTVGWLGVTSSIAGLLILIDPIAKLTPQ